VCAAIAVCGDSRKDWRVAYDNVLVTGATGRVGAQLLPAFEGSSGLRLLDREAGPDLDGARWFVGQLTDREVLDRALDGVDAVVHLAGNPDPDADWQELEEPNVEGFVALLAAADRHRVRRVVFASSVHAMGAYEGAREWPIEPGWPPAPCCAYGATKAFDEALARAYAYRTHLSLVALRFGLCAEEATAQEARAGWLAPPDLRDIVGRALTADVRFGVYNAVSWVSRDRWDLRSSIGELGYEPVRGLGEDDGRDAEAAGGGRPGEEHLITCTPPRR
jgi:NAD(P)-dependent dehydrogenase (short-subunit alcohol dehydrogenase family)